MEQRVGGSTIRCGRGVVWDESGMCAGEDEIGGCTNERQMINGQ